MRATGNCCQGHHVSAFQRGGPAHNEPAAYHIAFTVRASAAAACSARCRPGGCRLPAQAGRRADPARAPRGWTRRRRVRARARAWGPAVHLPVRGWQGKSERERLCFGWPKSRSAQPLHMEEVFIGTQFCNLFTSGIHPKIRDVYSLMCVCVSALACNPSTRTKILRCEFQLVHRCGCNGDGASRH